MSKDEIVARLAEIANEQNRAAAAFLPHALQHNATQVSLETEAAILKKFATYLGYQLEQTNSPEGMPTGGIHESC